MPTLFYSLDVFSKKEGTTCKLKCVELTSHLVEMQC